VDFAEPLSSTEMLDPIAEVLAIVEAALSTPLLQLTHAAEPSWWVWRAVGGSCITLEMTPLLPIRSLFGGST
jgi:hypothetical protein